MKIALLGGDGFVGRNIRDVFDKHNINYIIASRKTGTDLRDLGSAENFFKKSSPDIIINCAAHVGSLNYVTVQAADIITDNTKMILSMYEAVKKVCPQAIIINLVANCIYPAHTEIYSEDQIWNGIMHRSVLSFGGTRRMLLLTAECFNMQYNIKSINLVVPNMYGPYDSTDPNKAHALNALVSKFVKAKNEKEKDIEIWGTGVAIREWLYAKDLGRILLEIINNPKMIGLSEPINIAQNFGLSIRELIDIIQSHFQYEYNLKYDSSKPDGAPKKVMDDQKFKKVFPDFKFTNFDEGIKNTIDYYNEVLK